MKDENLQEEWDQLNEETDKMFSLLHKRIKEDNISFLQALQLTEPILMSVVFKATSLAIRDGISKEDVLDGFFGKEGAFSSSSNLFNSADTELEKKKAAQYMNKMKKSVEAAIKSEELEI